MLVSAVTATLRKVAKLVSDLLKVDNSTMSTQSSSASAVATTLQPSTAMAPPTGAVYRYLSPNSEVMDTTFARTDVTTNATTTIHLEYTLAVITYSCAGLSIASILLTLVSYFGYRKFNVKRPHIIMVNLCVCLLFYFVAYILSNPERHHTSVHHHDKSYDSMFGFCITGAFICHLTILCSWFWITIYWFVLLLMYRKPMGGHISHFFVKASLPAYGVPLLISVTTIVAGSIRDEVHDETDNAYVNDSCFVNSYYLFAGLIAPFSLTAIPIVGIFTYVIHGMLTSHRSTQLQHRLGDSRRVKVHLIKLTIITVLIACLLIDTAVVPAVRKSYEGDGSVVIGVVFAVVSVGLGLLLMFLFCIHQEEIRNHWVSVVRGKNKSYRRNHSLSRGAANDFADQTQRKPSMNRKDSYYIETQLSDPTRPNYKILPKQDTDLTTLNLVKIPGTPSPGRDRKHSHKSGGGGGGEDPERAPLKSPGGKKIFSGSRNASTSSQRSSQRGSQRHKHHTLDHKRAARDKSTTQKQQQLAEMNTAAARDPKRRSMSTNAAFMDHRPPSVATKVVAVPSRNARRSIGSSRESLEVTDFV